METRKKTTAGVLVWTPAPACTSPTSSVIYEDVWEDENGEQAEKDDFVSQMDENGIIGLSGALKNVELGETCSDEDSDCNPGCHPTVLTSEKLYPDDNMMGSVEAQRENKDMKREKRQRIEHLTVRGEYLDASIKMKQRDKKEKSSDGTRTENDHSCSSGKLGAINGLTKSYINKVENEKNRSLHGCGHQTPTGTSCQHCPVPQSALAFPHLLHFNPEEFAAAPGIDAETFPEMDFIESLPDSQSSLKSSPHSPRKSESNEQKGHQVAAVCPKQVVSQTGSLKSRQSPGRDSGTHTVNTSTKAAEVNKSKKWALSYRTPDFSKVEPRVRFPKNGYTPPKSRLSSKKEFPGSPVVYKSPAEIMKEILLETSSSACEKPPSSALSATVPQDFRSWQQATTLLEQLQEDYNRLLTKYAEAENTIDRLRLEAKVNLYSDLPKPGHAVQSRLSHDASKLMTLDFPQAQKADIKSTFLSNGHSSSQKQVDKILYIQAESFLQQLQAYQDILRGKGLKPPEQMRGLSQLAEALDSLERGYLLAKDDHKRLQQEGTKVSHFDPERKLEGLIYQCGLHMDELKEQVEKIPKGQSTCEAPPSLPSDPNLSRVSSDTGKTLPRPQIPSVSLLADYGAVEVSSVSEESDPTGLEDDEIFKSFYLKPVADKHRCVAKDSASVDVNVKSNHQDYPPLHTIKQQTSRSLTSLHSSTTLPVRLPSSSRRLAVGKSCSTSLSSLGEITSSHTRNSTHQTGSSKLLPQNGIISPEADSGFVGSERSHLTPLAAWSPLHQRAPESSEAVHHNGRTKKPLTVTTTSLASSPSHSHVEPTESSHITPDQPMRSRQGQKRHTFSCSPQHWVIQTEQPRMNCRTSGFGLESGSTHSVSEDGQSDQFNKSVTSVHSSDSSSRPSMRYRQGNSLRAPRISQVVNRIDAIQLLQAELTTLKERLECCVENNKLHSSVNAAPPGPCSTFAPNIRPGAEQQNDISRGRVQTSTGNEVEELRRGARMNASAHRQKAQSDIVTVSELKSSIVSPQPQMSRCTQTSAVETDNCPHTNAVDTRMPSRQKPDVSIRDRACQASLHPRCSSHRGESQADGKTEAASSSHCRHCPVCGRPNTYQTSYQECCRSPDSATYKSCQPPLEFTDKAGRSRFVAAPPALLQCMSVCPPPILKGAGTSSAVRGRGGTSEVMERNRRSLSADKQRSLDRSLNRAIRAARHMKYTSRRMAHSLATGLEYQQLLSQSCTY